MSFERGGILKLVEFEQTRGTKVFVNPETVVAIWETNEGSTSIKHIAEDVYWVKEDLDTVRKVLERGTDGNTSDGYHTFNELYHHRAVLFSVICEIFRDKAWKSKKHHDGTMYDGMFIIGIDTPLGQATYHYDINPYWEKFENVKELANAPKWDGHTSDEAIERIESLKYEIV